MPSSAQVSRQACERYTDAAAPLVIAGNRPQCEGTGSAGVRARLRFPSAVDLLDHGAAGTGEPLAVLLRAGNAESDAVADHRPVIGEALAQLPGYDGARRPGKNVLVRVDGASGTHGLNQWLTGRRLAYSVGIALPGRPVPRSQPRVERLFISPG
jgi:hypothetical protein